MGKRINNSLNFQKDALQNVLEHDFLWALLEQQQQQQQQKVPNFWEKPEKENKSAADVGPTSAWEKLSPIFGSEPRDSESLIDIDWQNQRLRHEFWTECAR